MTDPILTRKLQELINRFGHDAVVNAMPAKKVLNEIDRENDRNRDRIRNTYKFDRDHYDDGLPAMPIIKDKPPDDAAPSIISKDQVNNEKVKKYRAIEGLVTA